MADVQIAVIDQQNTEVTVAVPGVQGPVGQGVPSGGTANQVLFKQSGTDYDTTWGEVTSAMIGDLEIVDADVAANAEIAVSKLADGSARQLLQTDAAGTGVEWTSNVDVPGTLDVTGATTLDSTLTVPLGSAASPTLRFSGDANTGVYSPGADQVAISSNSSERIRIGANGEIGLSGANYGTSGQVLTSAGSGAAPTWQTPAATTDKIEEGNTSAEVIDTGSNGRFVVTTEGTERLRVTDTGLVGIGISSPLTILGLPYTDTTGVRHGISWSSGAIDAARIEMECTGIGFGRRADLIFSTMFGNTAATERMRIDNTGRIIAHTGGLEITRTIDSGAAVGSFISSSATGANQYGLYVRLDSDPNNTSQYFLDCFGGVGNRRAQIRSNGGLANYQSNNVDLSDERTKRDITPVSTTWNCVQAWNVVNYNYIDDDVAEAARIGVIAQQVQQHCPEVVIPYQEAEDAVLDKDGNVLTPAKEERLGVREQQMMWMAVKALQEAMERIETLEAKVAALESA